MSVSANLCQTGTATCGACCGEYNFRDHSRAAIEAALWRNTRALRDTPRTRAAYAAKAAELKAGAPAPLFPLVRVCPLLGFLDAHGARIGCLAHPKVIGVDLRDCGVYTSDICESFTCPSYLWLDDDLAALIRDACPDWYGYGLVVTDVEFVRACLSQLVERLSRPVTATELRARALPEVAALFALKAHAPGQAKDGRIFGRFEDTGAEDPVMRVIDHEALGASSAPEDLLVLCLGVAPRTLAELASARTQVRERLEAITSALRRLERTGS